MKYYVYDIPLDRDEASGFVLGSELLFWLLFFSLDTVTESKSK